MRFVRGCAEQGVVSDFAEGAVSERYCYGAAVGVRVAVVRAVRVDLFVAEADCAGGEFAL